MHRDSLCYLPNFVSSREQILLFDDFELALDHSKAVGQRLYGRIAIMYLLAGPGYQILRSYPDLDLSSTESITMALKIQKSE